MTEEAWVPLRPEGYVELDSCHNCRHCLDQSHQDGELRLCTFGKPAPPVVLDFSCACYDKWEIAWLAFCRWETDNDVRHVCRGGKCPQWDGKR